MTAIDTPITNLSALAPAGDRLCFDRCVDWLLTLHDSSEDPAVQALAADVLGELRELGPSIGEFEDVVFGALASVESAFEIAAAAA